MFCCSLRERFAQVAGVKRELNRADFEQVVAAEIPSLAGTAISNLFDAVDTDRSGTVDFQELCIGLSKMTRDGIDAKIDFMFSVR